MSKKTDKKDIIKPVTTKREQNKIELEQLVMRCIVMRFTEKESLAYIEAQYKPLLSSSYYNIKKTVQANLITKGYEIASEDGFFEEHLMRIESLKTVEKELWVTYHKETHNLSQAVILEKIQNIQVFLASANDYTRVIINNQEALRFRIAKCNNKKLKSKT